MINKIANDILYQLSLKKERLVLVESCTGGKVSSIFTDIPGASKVFWGGYVVYDNSAKNRMVSVSLETLERFGAVSAECVAELLSGAIEASGCDVAAAVSGIAGPDGGTKDKPVGTVFIGVQEKGKKSIIKKYLFDGNRNDVRNQSVLEILNLLKKTV